MNNVRLPSNIVGDISLSYINSNGTNSLAVVGIDGIPIQSGTPTGGDYLTLSLNGQEWNYAPITVAGDVNGPVNGTRITSLAGVPLTGAVPQDGQVLTYIAVNNNVKLNNPDNLVVNNLNFTQSQQAGTVYVSDNNNSRIVAFDNLGTFEFAWGTPGSGAGQFNSPQGIAIDGSGNVYVADSFNSRVQKFDDNGNYLTQWGILGSGNGQFLNPYDITILAPGFNGSAGFPLVCDTGNNRIQVFDSNGNYLTQWGTILGSAVGQFALPYSAAYYGGPAVSGSTIGISGYIYVTDWLNQRVDVLNYPNASVATSGFPISYSTSFGVLGSGNGQFLAPYGIDYNPNSPQPSGSLYVTDFKLNTVQEFTLAGGYIDQWGSTGTGNGQFATALGIANDAYGNIYVADAGNGRIEKFVNNGIYITQWGESNINGVLNYVDPIFNEVIDVQGIPIANSPTIAGQVLTYSTNPFSGQFFNPTNISYGNGHISMLNTEDGSASNVQILDLNGIPISHFITDQPSKAITGFGIDSTGHTYILYGNTTSEIQKYASTGQLIYDNILSNNIKQLAIDGSGNWYSSNSTSLYQYNSLSSLTGTTSILVSGLAYTTAAIAASPNTSSNLTIALAYPQIATIGSYNLSTSVTTYFGGTGTNNGRFLNIQAITLDQSNNIYVLDNSLCRVQKFNSAGSYITQWGQQGSAIGDFRNPLSITSDTSNNIYVLDEGNSRIQKFSSTGTFIIEWSNLPGNNSQLIWEIPSLSGYTPLTSGTPAYGDLAAFYPNPTVVGIEGSAILNLPSALGQILTYNPNGNPTSAYKYSYQFGASSLSNPDGIAIDTFGNIFVIDTGANTLNVYSSAGVFVTSLTGLNHPADVAVLRYPSDAANTTRVYIANTNSQQTLEYKYKAGTGFTYQAILAPGFSYPQGITAQAIGADVYTYVADTDNNRIFVSKNGGSSFTFGSIGSGNGQFINPGGMVTDPSNYLYVVDGGNHRVQKFTWAGSYVTQWGSLGAGNGQFENPLGIGIDNLNNIYVPDTSLDNCQVFSPSGTYITQFGNNGSGNGQFIAPVRVAFSSPFIYVTDNGNNRIEAFSYGTTPGVGTWNISSLAGDIAFNNFTTLTTAAFNVTGIQGQPVVSTPATSGQALVYNGTNYTPTAIGNTTSLKGIPLSNAGSVNGQTYIYNAGNWVATAITGDVSLSGTGGIKVTGIGNVPIEDWFGITNGSVLTYRTDEIPNPQLNWDVPYIYGDVIGSTLSNVAVSGFMGIPISGYPQDGQGLIYSSGNNRWLPTTLRKPPTIQRFTSGTGTYTTPTSVAPLYITIEMIGGGGGGGGSSSVGSGGGNASNGGDTTFGTSLLTAGGGVGGQFANQLPSAGGTNTSNAGPVVLVNVAGGEGGAAITGTTGTGNSMYMPGGYGGPGPFGGSGGPQQGNASANTGAGGAGGSTNCGASTTFKCGSGGGAGGYLKVQINSPAATYSYGIGAGTSGGSGGSSGQPGGTGGSGVIIVTEYYQ